MTRPTILDQDVVVVPRGPVAWRYRDFADGWILDHSKASSEGYCSATGAKIQPLFASPHADAWAEVRVYVGELEARIIAAWNSFGKTLAETIEEADELPLIADGGLDEQISALTRQRDTAEARISELEARLKEAERVIEPFAARAANSLHDNHKTAFVYASDLQAARTFMEGSK